MPLGAILTFVVDLGVCGLWWGMTIGIYLSAAIGLWYLRRVDWDKEVRKTLKRLSTIIASTRQSVDDPSAESVVNVANTNEDEEIR